MVYIVDMVYTVDTADTVDTVDTVDTYAMHEHNILYWLLGWKYT